MITPVLLARRWTRTGSADGRGGGPAGRTPRRPLTCSGVSGVGAGAEQLAAGGVEEHQGVLLDADRDPAAGQDLGGVQLPPGQRDQAGVGYAAVCLGRVAVFGRRQRRGTGRDCSVGDQPGQVVNRRVGADGLEPGPAD